MPRGRIPGPRTLSSAAEREVGDGDLCLPFPGAWCDPGRAGQRPRGVPGQLPRQPLCLQTPVLPAPACVTSPLWPQFPREWGGCSVAMRPGSVVKQAAWGSGVGARSSPGPVGPETTGTLSRDSPGRGAAGGVAGASRSPPTCPSGASRAGLRSPESPERPEQQRGLAGPCVRWPVDNKTNALLTDCRALNPPGRHDDVSANRLLNS